MLECLNHNPPDKKGFKLLSSSSNAIGRGLRSSSGTVAPRNRKGFNLIEAAVVLALVGAVIGAIWWAASAVRETQKIQRFSEDIYLSLSKLRDLYQNQQIPSSYQGGQSLLGSLLPGAGHWGIKYPWDLDINDPDGSSFYVGLVIDGYEESGHAFEKYVFNFLVSYPDRKTCVRLVNAMIKNDLAAKEIYLVFQRASNLYQFQGTLTSAQQAYTLAQTHCTERDLSLTGHYTGGYNNVQFRFTQK